MEPINPVVIESPLKIIDALTGTANHPAVSGLYAIDPQDPDLFAREQGNGELKVSGIGDSRVLQIRQGNNLLLVKYLDEKLKKRLRLDEPSQRALAEYLATKPETEKYRHPPKKEREVLNPEQKELRCLGLERFILPGYPEADQLISRILISTNRIDIADKKGQEHFCLAWKRDCGDLPTPCIPPEYLFKQLYPGQKFPEGDIEETGDFSYLGHLVDNNIIKNLSGRKQPTMPHFGEKETIYAMNWVEEDFNAADASGDRKLGASSYTSSLLSELGIDQEGVVNISRKTIDEALWEGDPGLRKPTSQHKKILLQLGFKDDEWEIHCIRQDQYARLAEAKKLGQHELLTHYDDYLIVISGVRDGLIGGHVNYGGASFVGNVSRGFPNELYATRLVISRKRKY